MGMNKLKLGIYGSAVDEPKAFEKASQLGTFLGDYSDKIILINGACASIPYLVCHTAHRKGVEVWGFSGELNQEEQNKTYPEQDNIFYSKLFFVPETFEFCNDPMARKKYRNVTSTASCDAGIVIAGRWGTMNEFTNLFDMGKVIGILTGTGGIADELPHLISKVNKPSEALIIIRDDPEKLVEEILKVVKKY
jgi:hypothetical protein